MKRFLLGVIILLLGCDRKQPPSPSVDLDVIPPRPRPGAFQTARDSQVIRGFEAKLDTTKEFSVREILSAQMSYGNAGNLENVKQIYENLRQEQRTGSIVDSRHIYYAALTLESSYLDYQKWDSAIFYLDVADSFWFASAGGDENEVLNRQRRDRSIALEHIGRTDEILRIWRNQCIGMGEEILARALRRKFGKDRIKVELEKAMKHPVVVSANLKFVDGRYLREMVPHLPDGDSAYMVDFGGLFVRVDLPEKACYLWAPVDDDSIFNVQAYLNNFRNTRFCKILQDIDPDARE